MNLKKALLKAFIKQKWIIICILAVGIVIAVSTANIPVWQDSLLFCREICIMITHKPGQGKHAKEMIRLIRKVFGFSYGGRRHNRNKVVILEKS